MKNRIRFISHQGKKILLVDFDETQSFGHAANGWVMHPVVTGGELQAQ